MVVAGFVSAPQWALAVEQLDVEAVALELAEGMPLPPAELRTSPAPDRLVVSERVSLFLDRWEPLVVGRSVGSRLVHVTATPEWVTIDPGTGDAAITCRGGRTVTQSECTFRFKRSSEAEPGGRFVLRAVVRYELTYTTSDDPGVVKDLGAREVSGSLSVRVADFAAVNEGIDLLPTGPPPESDDAPEEPVGEQRTPRDRSRPSVTVLDIVLLGPAVAIAVLMMCVTWSCVRAGKFDLAVKLGVRLIPLGAGFLTAWLSTHPGISPWHG